MKGERLERQDFVHWASTKTEGNNIWYALMHALRPQSDLHELLDICAGKYEHGRWLNIEALACIVNLLEDKPEVLESIDGIGQKRFEQLGQILVIALSWYADERQ